MKWRIWQRGWRRQFKQMNRPEAVHAASYEIAKERAAHVLHYKIHRYGGLLPCQRMSAIAEAAGLEISVAPYFDIIAAAAAHLAAATPIAKWPAGFSDMTDTILAEPYEPDGQILAATRRDQDWASQLMRTNSLTSQLAALNLLARVHKRREE